MSEETQRLISLHRANALSDTQRQTLMASALADQEVFDALMDGEIFAGMLADPSMRRSLRNAFEVNKPWYRRPLEFFGVRSWRSPNAGVAKRPMNRILALAVGTAFVAIMLVSVLPRPGNRNVSPPVAETLPGDVPARESRAGNSTPTPPAHSDSGREEPDKAASAVRPSPSPLRPSSVPPAVTPAAPASPVPSPLRPSSVRPESVPMPATANSRSLDASRDIQPLSAPMSIVLRRPLSGGSETVDSSATFHNGDRFQLEIRVSQPVYICILGRSVHGDPESLSRRLSSGEVDLARALPGREGDITPYKVLSGSSRVTKDAPLVFSGQFVKDTPGGVDRLYILASPVPLGPEFSGQAAQPLPEAELNRRIAGWMANTGTRDLSGPAAMVVDLKHAGQ